MTSDFDSDFDFSSTAAADALVRRACHRLVADCCGVARATPAEDRRGVDYWISTPRGRVGLDLKLRRKDYGSMRGGSIDCVIELDGHGSSGWLLKPNAAALVLFACIDSHRVALFKTKALQTAVMLNLTRWLSTGRAREIATDSTREGRTWKNRAVIISGDLLTAAIDRLEYGQGDAAANEGDGL
jgi:hypothetical protein